jgi:hypothetical protein
MAIDMRATACGGSATHVVDGSWHDDRRGGARRSGRLGRLRGGLWAYLSGAEHAECLGQYRHVRNGGLCGRRGVHGVRAAGLDGAALLLGEFTLLCDARNSQGHNKSAAMPYLLSEKLTQLLLTSAKALRPRV